MCILDFWYTISNSRILRSFSWVKDFIIIYLVANSCKAWYWIKCEEYSCSIDQKMIQLFGKSNLVIGLFLNSLLLLTVSFAKKMYIYSGGIYCACSLLLLLLGHASSLTPLFSPQVLRDEHELEDARWFSREEVRTAVELSCVDPMPWLKSSGDRPSFVVPPPMTIAHCLMRYWLANTV